MLSTSEEKWLNYIEQRARHNVKGRSFFRVTDILEEAFALPEEKAYDVLKNLMGRQIHGNSPDIIIKEYISMLEKGYGSIKEQMEVLGGNKLLSVKATVEIKCKKFEGGTFMDVLKEVYNVSDEELMPLIERYLTFLNSKTFSYELNEETFNDFLETNMDELERQAERFER